MTRYNSIDKHRVLKGDCAKQTALPAAVKLQKAVQSKNRWENPNAKKFLIFAVLFCAAHRFRRLANAFRLTIARQRSSTPPRKIGHTIQAAT